jgi:hypothetical protein
MATVTLVESAKLAQNELVAGIIENVITINRMFEVLPFDGISGNALAYNRENVLGDVQALGVNGTITAKAAATFTQVTSSLTTLIGDAEVNGLIQATRSSDGNDQTAVQIASKAKSIGREYQDQLINGTGATDEFNGLINLCVAGQTAATGANGGPLSFAFMDEMMDLVVDKDGVVDWMAMPARTIRSYYALLRALGGASIGDVVQLPSGEEVPGYRGVPIFRNDYIPTNQVKGGGSAQTTIFAGTFDDGSRQHGIAGLTAQDAAGDHIWRIKWYCGLALFSEKGLACADGITN